MTRRRARGIEPSSAMRPRMALGDFLVAYLKRHGVTHLFGLPGDLVLGLFHRFGRDRALEIVTFSHEPSVGFAADGYARSTRRLGVVCVTYGAGGNNVVNPVAGAYAEQVPILVVSGGPGEAEQKLSGIHHQAKDVESQWRIFQQVTCAAQIVQHPERAALEIHEVVRKIAMERRPGYLEIHRDFVDVEIPIPREIVEWDGTFPRPTSDARKLSEAVTDTIVRVRAAKRPVLIGGLELYRAAAERDFLELAEKLGVAVVTTVDAKGVFPMDHPLHMGIHVGPFSPPAIQKRVRGADLVLALGTLLTDMNLGAAKPQVRRERSVWALGERVNVSFHQYTDVMLRDFVAALAKQRLPNYSEKVVYRDNLVRKRSSGQAKARADAAPLSNNDLLLEVNEFLAANKGYHVFAESGDMLFGGLELRLHGGGLYFAQGYYASMGFAVPASLGAQIGTGVRPLVLCGDGGFQMTGPEISHAPARGLSPVVVLLNNSGWQIFRPVSPREDLLSLPNWPYAELAQAWGGVGFRAETRAELREALRAAHEVREFVLIECRLSPDDLSPVTRRYIRASARRAGTGKAARR
ncbi:MAG TPA: thiamine pyrophosphate-binding protein [Myxococcota bacterium]|nr:thiamine pyrophosphate-binding protein [Myxococcota bacterium]